MSVPQQYNFNRDFQQQIVSMMVREANFLYHHRDSIDAKFFTFEIPAVLARLITNHYDTYSLPPGKDTLHHMLVEYATRMNMPHDLQREFFNTLDSIFVSDLSNADYLFDQVATFGKRQALRSAVGQIVNLLDTGTVDNYDQSVNIITKALQVGSPKDPGMLFSRVASDLPRLGSEDMMYGTDFKIKTLFPSLDKAIVGHGIGPGEVMIIMAPTKVGKSTLAINFAVNAMYQGKNVAVITLELKSLDEVLRIGSRITGLSIQNIIENPDVYQSLLEDRKQNITGDLLVKYFTRKTIGISGIKSHLTSLESTNQFKPDMIVIDSADHCLPPKGRTYEKDYRQYGLIYEELVRLADDMRSPIITTSQVGRGAYGQDSYGFEFIRESIEKAEICDIGLAICETQEERNKNECRIYVAGIRRGKSQFFIECTKDMATCLIQEKVQYVQST